MGAAAQGPQHVGSDVIPAQRSAGARCGASWEVAVLARRAAEAGSLASRRFGPRRGDRAGAEGRGHGGVPGGGEEGHLWARLGTAVRHSCHSGKMVRAKEVWGPGPQSAGADW